MARRKLSDLMLEEVGGENLNKDNFQDADSSEVLLEQIHLPESQPRRYFDSQKLEQLTTSIKSHGILEPLLVRPLPDGGYELVAGERRYRAAQAAGLDRVPIIARELTDMEATRVALEENLQREDLNPVEETEGILQLLGLQLEVKPEQIPTILNAVANAKKRDQELTGNVSRQIETIAETLTILGKGTPESFRTSKLPLLNLPPEILESLRQGQLAYTKAKEIAKVKDESARETLLKDSIDQSFSLTQIKERVKALRPPKKSDAGLQSHVDTTLKRVKKAKLWDDPKRSKKLESLLNQIDKLLEEE